MEDFEPHLLAKYSEPVCKTRKDGDIGQTVLLISFGHGACAPLSNPLTICMQFAPLSSPMNEGLVLSIASNDAKARYDHLVSSLELIPWYDEAQLQQIGTSLHSLHPMALEDAEVWRIRNGDDLPHAIESTVGLARTLSRAQHMHLTSITSSEIRWALATTVIRAINGLADVLQQGRAQATSVSILCRQLGIPLWLVDVRHEATHNRLPHLPTLQLAGTTLLDYFYKVYWEKRIQRRQQALESCTKLLKEYEEAITAMEATLKQDVVPETRISNKIPSIFADDDGEDEDDEVPKGSYGNRFAVLQEDKSKKKRKTSPKKKPPSKKKTKKGSNEQPKAVVKKLLDRVYPPTLVYSFLLNYLVRGNGTTTGCFFQTGLDFEKSFNRYKLLIHSYSREWPGFFSYLLIHLVDLIVVRPPGDLVQSQRMSLLSARWVDKLLSYDFLVEWNQTLAKEMPKQKFSSRHVLLSVMKYPLYSLRRRCIEALNMNTRALVETFDQILEDSDNDSVLGAPVGDTKVENGGQSQASVVPWGRCERWEACALGSLPGHPNNL